MHLIINILDSGFSIIRIIFYILKQTELMDIIGLILFHLVEEKQEPLDIPV